MIRVSQGFSLGLNVIPLWGIFLDPNGVLHLSPGFYPGIHTITHPTTRTLKGCNVSAPGFNPGIKSFLTPTPAPQRGATLLNLIPKHIVRQMEYCAASKMPDTRPEKLSAYDAPFGCRYILPHHQPVIH